MGCGTKDAPRPDIQINFFCTENIELRVWFWMATFLAFLLEDADILATPGGVTFLFGLWRFLGGDVARNPRLRHTRAPGEISDTTIFIVSYRTR